MTKVAICYGSRYGTTHEIAKGMAETAKTLGAEVDVIELKKEKLSTPLEEYDLVIIGSGIQVGRWTKEPLQFIEKHRESLSKQKVAFFVVCGDAGIPAQCDFAQKQYLDDVLANFPEINPLSTGLFAGMYNLKKYNFATRALIKSIIRKQFSEKEEIPEVLDFRDWDQINGWITSLIQM